MAVALSDANFAKSLIAVDSSDGTTIVRVLATPDTHLLKVDDSSTGTDFGPQVALHDDNFVPTLLAVSSATITVNGIDYIEGVTPVAVYADSDGNLLVDSA